MTLSQQLDALEKPAGTADEYHNRVSMMYVVKPRIIAALRAAEALRDAVRLRDVHSWDCLCVFCAAIQAACSKFDAATRELSAALPKGDR